MSLKDPPEVIEYYRQRVDWCEETNQPTFMCWFCRFSEPHKQDNRDTNEK